MSVTGATTPDLPNPKESVVAIGASKSNQGAGSAYIFRIHLNKRLTRTSRPTTNIQPSSHPSSYPSSYPLPSPGLLVPTLVLVKKKQHSPRHYPMVAAFTISLLLFSFVACIGQRLARKKDRRGNREMEMPSLATIAPSAAAPVGVSSSPPMLAGGGAGGRVPAVLRASSESRAIEAAS